MRNRILIAGIIILGAVALGLAWIFFGSSGQEAPERDGAPPFFQGEPGPSDTARGPGEAGEGGAPHGRASARVRQLHEKPVVAGVLLARGGTYAVRFMEQGTGHVFERDASGTLTRISNTSIPGVLRGLWSSSGTLLIFQYLEGEALKTASATLSATTSSSGFRSLSFLPDGLRAVAPSPRGDEVAYILESASGSSVRIARPDGSREREVFTSPLRLLSLTWPGENNLVVWSRAAGERAVAYRVGVSGGVVRIAEESLPGSVISSASARAHIAPSFGGVSLFVAGENETSFATIPEKCSFVPASETKAWCAMPRGFLSTDLWHQGVEGSVDELWIVDFERGERALFLGAEDMGERVFDMELLAGSAQADRAIFRERASGLLFMAER